MAIKKVKPKPVRLTEKQARRGYEVSLAALKAIATTVAREYAAVYAHNVVVNLENGKFLK